MLAREDASLNISYSKTSSPAGADPWNLGLLIAGRPRVAIMAVAAPSLPGKRVGSAGLIRSLVEERQTATIGAESLLAEEAIPLPDDLSDDLSVRCDQEDFIAVRVKIKGKKIVFRVE